MEAPLEIITVCIFDGHVFEDRDHPLALSRNLARAVIQYLDMNGYTIVEKSSIAPSPEVPG